MHTYFGVEWKKVEKAVRKEHETQGYNGRFGPGLPRVSDGSLLFLLHLINKMRPAVDGGSRFGIVLNGSPLFTGGAGSGESEIRRYVLENDLVEAIIGLPTDLFYTTGISTYDLATHPKSGIDPFEFGADSSCDSLGHVKITGELKKLHEVKKCSALF